MKWGVDSGEGVLEGVTSEWNKSSLGRGNIRYKTTEALKSLSGEW